MSQETAVANPYICISQDLSPTVPLCTVHLLKVPPELLPDWEARHNTTNIGKRLRVNRRAFSST